MSISSEIFEIQFIVNSNLAEFSKTAEAAAVAAKNAAINMKAMSSDVGRASGAWRDAQAAQSQFVNDLSRNFEISSQITHSSIKRFGSDLQNNQLSLQQARNAMKEYKNATTEATSQISLLAKEQVRMSQSYVQPIAKRPTGQIHGNVITPLAGDFSTVAQQTQLAEEKAKAYEAVQTRINQKTIDWGKNVQWTGRQLTVGLTLPIAAIGYAAVKAFNSVDQELVRLTKVYGDVQLQGKALEQQNNMVRDSAMKVANEMAQLYGQSSKDTIALMADIAATGKTGNDLTAATEQTTRLMVLGEVDRQDAMNTTLSLQNAFKVSTQELAGTIDFMNGVENQTSLTLQDLTTAIPKAGTVVKSLGGNVKDLALFMTSLKVGGVQAAEGANALKTGLARIIDAPRAAKDQLKVFGIDIDTIVQKNKGNIVGLVTNLRDEINKSVPQNDQASVYEKLFGKWQYAKIMAMFNNFDSAQANQVRQLASMTKAQLAAISGSEIKTQQESLSGRWKILTAQAQASLIQIGQSIEKVLVFVGEKFQSVFGWIGRLPTGIKQILEIVLAVGALVGPFTMLVGLGANFYGTVKNMILSSMSWAKNQRGVTKEYELMTAQMQANEKLSNLLSDGMKQGANNAELFAEAVKGLVGNLAAAQAEAMGLDSAMAKSAARKEFTNSMMNISAPGPLSIVGNPSAGGIDPVLLGRARKNFSDAANSYYLVEQDNKKYAVAVDSATNTIKGIATTTGVINEQQIRMIPAYNKLSIAAQEQIIAMKQNTEAQQLAAGKTRSLSGMATSPLAKGGAVMAGAMIAGSIPSDSLGGFGSIAQGVSAGGGMGMLAGPWGAGIGAGIGAATAALKMWNDQINKTENETVSAFKQSSFAVDQFGLSVKNATDVDISGFLKGSSEAITAANALRDAINKAPGGTPEKDLAASIKGDNNTQSQIDKAITYAMNQAAMLPDNANAEDKANFKKKLDAMITGIFSSAEKPVPLDLRLQLNKIDITNKNDVENYLASQIKDIRPHAVATQGPGGMGYMGSSGMGSSGATTLEYDKKSYQQLASILNDIPFNTTVQGFNKMTDALKANGVDLNSNAVDLNQLKSSLQALPGGDKLAGDLQDLHDKGYSLTDSFRLLSAEANHLMLNIDDLNKHAGDSAYLKHAIDLAQANISAWNQYSDAATKQIDKQAAAQKAALGIVSPEAAAANAKNLQSAADAAKTASDNSIKNMQDNFKKQEDATQKNIDLTKKRYDDEIKKIQDAEAARQKAFDAEQTRIQRANEQRNMQIDYQKALYSGKYFDAMTIKSNMAAKNASYALQDTNTTAKDAAQAKINKLTAKRDSVIAQMQARADEQKKSDAAAIQGAQNRATAQQASYKKQIDAAKNASHAQTSAQQASVDAIDASAKKLKDDLAANWQASQGDAKKAMDMEVAEAKSHGIDLARNLIGPMAQLLNSMTTGSGVFAPGYGTNAWMAPPGKATGGLINGSGTKKSDSNLIRVSNKEFVMQADAVDFYGPDYMDAINQKKLRRFASGGYTGYAVGGQVTTPSYRLSDIPSASAAGVQALASIDSGSGSMYNTIHMHFNRTYATVDQISSQLDKALDSRAARMGNR